jgi:hypothetical protein
LDSDSAILFFKTAGFNRSPTPPVSKYIVPPHLARASFRNTYYTDI